MVNGIKIVIPTNYFTIQNLPNNTDMANQGLYLELGQPYYVKSLYFGCEFPSS